MGLGFRVYGDLSIIYLKPYYVYLGTIPSTELA